MTLVCQLLPCGFENSNVEKMYEHGTNTKTQQLSNGIFGHKTARGQRIVLLGYMI